MSDLLQVVATSALGPTQPDDVYIAYLPLAHVLELLAEFSFMILGEHVTFLVLIVNNLNLWIFVHILISGIGIGYSSPFTLTDTSLVKDEFQGLDT